MTIMTIISQVRIHEH